MDRAELDRRLGALGYACETDEQRGADGEIREMTWRRQVGVQKVIKSVPIMIMHQGKMLRAYEDEESEQPITRSLYVVDSKDGLEIYNASTRYTLEEIEKEELAEKEGKPLPVKAQVIT